MIRWILVLAAAVLVAGCGRPQSQPPTAIPGTKVDEKLNARIPLDLTFEDENANTVRLADFFRSGKPVILQLSYYNCPSLCTLISKGIVESLKDLTLTMGKDFEVVQVSINPDETSSLAYQKKQTSMAEFSKGHEKELNPAAWHLLVGKKSNIEKLADAVGYRYTYQASTKQYIHPAVIVVLTPDGRVSRYLYGVKFDPQTTRLSLVEASGGKVGNSFDKATLTCFQYDPNSGKYVIAAVRLMQIGAGLTLVVLSFAIWRWLRREKRRSAAEALASPR